MKNEKVDKIKSLWEEVTRSNRPEFSELKNRVAEFSMPILFEEIKYYQDVIIQVNECNKNIENLNKRIIVLEAMEKFDAQFRELSEDAKS